MSNLTTADLKRYQRHLNLKGFGVEGQSKLKEARVLVVGAGGLGCPALLYLAAAGTGTLGILDFDKIDISNLQRQILYTTDDVGKMKAEVASQRLNLLNPTLRFKTHVTKLSS